MSSKVFTRSFFLAQVGKVTGQIAGQADAAGHHNAILGRRTFAGYEMRGQKICEFHSFVSSAPTFNALI